MKFKTAAMEDFETVFHYIQALWTYNTYDKEEIRTVYERVIRDENSFAFLFWMRESIKASATEIILTHSGCPAEPAIYPVS